MHPGGVDVNCAAWSGRRGPRGRCHTIKGVWKQERAVSSLQGAETERRNTAMDKGSHEGAGHVNVGMGRVGGVD